MKKFLLTLLLTLIFFVGSYSSVNAAQFYLVPASTAVYQGSYFSVYLKVNSSDQASNSYSASIVFDSNYLEPVSVMKSGSICSLFIVEPTLSPGSASVTCGLPSPGFQGNSGTVAILNLRTKKVGTTYLGVSNGAILANDGKGTNILNASTGINIRILDTGALPPAREPDVTIPAPQIKSDRGISGEWMKDREINFSWNKPENAESFSYVLTKDPNVNPPAKSMTEGNSVNFKELEDGTYYFRLIALNGSSKSPIAEYVVRIDNSGPESLDVIIEPTNDEVISTIPLFGFIGIDNGSGLSKYQFSLDGSEFFDVTNPYILTNVSGGEHIAIIRALDVLGNYTDKAIPFRIIEIKAPTIDSPLGNSVIRGSDGVEISGKATPNSTILIFLNGKLYSTILSDGDGNFSFNFNRALEAGKYNISAQERSEGGVLGEMSRSLEITIESSFIPVSAFSILKDENTMIMIGSGCLLLLLIFTLFLVLLIKRRRKRRKYEQQLNAIPVNDLPDEGTTAIQGDLLVAEGNEENIKEVQSNTNIDNTEVDDINKSDISGSSLGTTLTTGKVETENNLLSNELTPEAKYDLQKRLGAARAELDQEIHDLERDLRKKVEDEPYNTLEEEHRMEAAITEAVEKLEEKVDKMLDPETIIEGNGIEDQSSLTLPEGTDPTFTPITDNRYTNQLPLDEPLSSNLESETRNIGDLKNSFKTNVEPIEGSREELLEGALLSKADAINIENEPTPINPTPIESVTQNPLSSQDPDIDTNLPSQEPVVEANLPSQYQTENVTQPFSVDLTSDGSEHVARSEREQSGQEKTDLGTSFNTSEIKEDPTISALYSPTTEVSDISEIDETSDKNEVEVNINEKAENNEASPITPENNDAFLASEKAKNDEIFDELLGVKEPVDHTGYSAIFGEDGGIPVDSTVLQDNTKTPNDDTSGE